MKEYIEREAAIEAVTEWYGKACRPENMSSYNMGERAAYTTAISEITEIPAADVRPAERGAWKETLYGWECTVCGEEQQYARRLKFCPNCGAMMEDEK